MKPLDALTERYPLLTGVAGAVSSCAGWFLDNIEQVNQVVQFLGGSVGLILGCMTLVSRIRVRRKQVDEER